ncbi:MAG: cytochrome c1, partial [Alphaproteobacteria bacterium]
MKFRRLWIQAGVLLFLGMGGRGYAEETPLIPKQVWPFSGMLGTFDRGALQRGFQVYKEV